MAHLNDFAWQTNSFLYPYDVFVGADSNKVQCGSTVTQENDVSHDASTSLVESSYYVSSTNCSVNTNDNSAVKIEFPLGWARFPYVVEVDVFRSDDLV